MIFMREMDLGEVPGHGEVETFLQCCEQGKIERYVQRWRETDHKGQSWWMRSFQRGSRLKVDF